MATCGNPSYPVGKRYDAAAVEAYMARHSALVPVAQLDVYVGYWVARQSEAQIAELEGLTRKTVAKRIARLRHRVKRATR